MAFLLLVVRSAFRNRLRTLLTSGGVAIAIIAFLFLRTFIAAWYSGVDAAAVDRLIVRNKTSLIMPLPRAYLEKLRGTAGVSDVSYANWFGGVYKDPKDFFAQFAAEAESFLRLYPEFLLSDAEKQAYLQDRTGCIAGDILATAHNWKVGDKIVLVGAIYPGNFEFTLRGIYKGRERNTDRQQFHFHWSYLNERLSETMRDKVGWYVLKVADPQRSSEVAAAVDKLFANSAYETRTESERAFQLSFLSMMSAVIMAIQVISAVVLVILILILGNTIAMASRERTTEYAVMRAVGFRPRHVIALVIGEGFVVALAGVLLGAAIAPPLLTRFAEWFQTKAGNFLGAFELSLRDVGAAVVVSLVGGMIASAVPAFRAGRLRIVDALRRIE